MGQHSVVTGGCGFIGSHLVDALLRAGHRVTVIDDLSSGRRTNLDPRARLIEASIADPKALTAAMEGADACFHLAAIASVTRSISAWGLSSQINLLGTVNVFEACAANATPVIYASSAAVYGTPAALPLTEAAQTRPVSPYGVDKLAAEWHARAGGACLGLRSVGLRLFNVYGPRQDPASPYSGVISIFIREAMAGRPLAIDGDGSQTRDFVHVSDVVRALIAARGAARAAAPVFNVACGREIAIADLAAQILRLARTPSTIIRRAARNGDIGRSWGDASALAQAVGWEPTTALESGLRELLESDRSLADGPAQV